MKYPCENCKLRAQYDKNPKSLVGRFWRWQINLTLSSSVTTRPFQASLMALAAPSVLPKLERLFQVAAF